MRADAKVAQMTQAKIGERMIKVTKVEVGAALRVEHSIKGGVGFRVAVIRFAAEIGELDGLGSKRGLPNARPAARWWPRPAGASRASLDGGAELWRLDDRAEIEARILAERPHEAQPRYREDVTEGTEDALSAALPSPGLKHPERRTRARSSQ